MAEGLNRASLGCQEVASVSGRLDFLCFFVVIDKVLPCWELQPVGSHGQDGARGFLVAPAEVLMFSYTCLLGSGPL